MNLKYLGAICRQYRIENLISVKDIAKQCNYTVWNVYKFERGGSSTLTILLSYMAHGLKLSQEDIWRVLNHCYK